MAWTWRAEQADGTVVVPSVPGADTAFPSQGDAETWLGETWRELLAAGVDQMSLFEEGRLVYGPMSLQA